MDSGCACAAHSLLTAGAGHVSVETKANFTRPIRAHTDRVQCAARVVDRSNQIISAGGGRTERRRRRLGARDLNNHRPVAAHLTAGGRNWASDRDQANVGKGP
jgi:acyl-coenzyme A thioesterase PaaI-like protein